MALMRTRGRFYRGISGRYDDGADYAFRLAEDLGTMSRCHRDDYSMFQPPDGPLAEWPFTCIDWEFGRRRCRHSSQAGITV